MKNIKKMHTSNSLSGRLMAAGFPVKIVKRTVALLMAGVLAASIISCSNTEKNPIEEKPAAVQEQTTKETTEDPTTDTEETTEGTEDAEEGKEVTLSEEETEQITDFLGLALLVWVTEGSNGAVDFTKDETLLRFSHMISNWSIYEDNAPFHGICKTIMSELGGEKKDGGCYYIISQSELRSLWMNLFGTEGGNLEGNQYMEVYGVRDDGEDNLEFEAHYDILEVEVNIDKVVEKKDGSYEITGIAIAASGTEEGLVEECYADRKIVCVNAVRRPESPFGFQFGNVSFDEVNGEGAARSQGENGFENVVGAYTNILIRPDEYPEFYPEYYPEQHPGYSEKMEAMDINLNGTSLWFALADADGNGVDELYLAHAQSERGGFYVVTNVLQYDEASGTVVDLDGDVVFKPNGYSAYLNKGGILYSGSEANTDYTFYYNIFTGELWSNDISSPDWKKEHDAEKVSLEWHEATVDNIVSYVNVK